MNTLVIGGNKVEVYSGIDEMPMANYHKFNKFLMFESGLAPDANGVVAHLSRMSELLQAGEYDKLKVELQSTYQSIAFVMDETPVTSMAFACMVYSINGKPIRDLSDETLRDVSLALNREKVGVLRKQVEELKKKLNTSFQPTSSKLFGGVLKRKRHLACQESGLTT